MVNFREALKVALITQDFRNSIKKVHAISNERSSSDVWYCALLFEDGRVECHPAETSNSPDPVTLGKAIVLCREKQGVTTGLDAISYLVRVVETVTENVECSTAEVMVGLTT